MDFPRQSGLCSQSHRGIGRIGSTWFLCNQTMHTATKAHIYTHIHTHKPHTHARREGYVSGNLLCTYIAHAQRFAYTQTPVTPTQRPPVDGGSDCESKTLFQITMEHSLPLHFHNKCVNQACGKTRLGQEFEDVKVMNQVSRQRL